VLQIDAYLSILVHQSPTIRYQEIRIPLPKSTRLWAAVDDPDRRKLEWDEPAGREKAIFSSLMREVANLQISDNLPHHLTPADYHLELCSLQVGIWEVAQETSSCESDEFVVPSSPTCPIQVRRAHQDLWRASAEEDCHLRSNYFTAPTPSTDTIFPPATLILYHLSAITLHAPFKLLKNQTCCPNCRTDTAMASRKNKTLLRAWVTAPQARTAVWNAAQIARILAKETARPDPSTFLLLNPLAIPALLDSAIVVCAYAHHTVACPACTGESMVDLVDIFGAGDDEERLVAWREVGVGLADWVPGQFPVCRCKVGTLAAWFRRVLAVDKSLEAEFVTFLRGLERV